MARRHVVALALAVLLPAGAARADAQFVEIAGSRGIAASTQESGQGTGVAAADFDGDGDVDLFVPQAAGSPDRLYRNLGDGNFEEIASAAGLDSTLSSRVALWFDYDGDDRLDLVVTTDCWKKLADCPTVQMVRLYRQTADAQFAETTVAAGLDGLFTGDEDKHIGGMAAGDVDGDGDLDLLLSEWEGTAKLMRNNGNGTFTDMTVQAGIATADVGHWQPMFHDFDGDGSLDIFWAIDFVANALYVNDGSGAFTESAAAAGLDNAMNDMGVSLADWDNDGDLDIYVTNIFFPGLHNVLFRNDSTPGSLAFTEVSVALGVDDGGWGWGTTSLDVDNDGDLDLAATNGYNQGDFLNDTSRFFLNTGTSPLAFSEVSATAGFDDDQWGSALVAFDHDRDGDLDIVQACAPDGLPPANIRLLDNQSTDAAANHWLVVQPRMSGPNRRAIGAVVRVTVGSTQQMRLISAGSSFFGQEPAEAFFGVGSATLVDEVVVEWPGGGSTVQQDVAVDQVLVVASDPDTDGDGVVDPDDCAPADDQAWSLPGPVGTLTLSSSDPATLQWTAPAEPGSVAWTFDTLASAAADDWLAASCLESGDGDLQALDPAAVPPGAVRYYLVRATNACGAGSGGSTTQGANRTLSACP